MSKKTMKDYIKDITPLKSKNTTTIFQTKVYHKKTINKNSADDILNETILSGMYIFDYENYEKTKLSHAINPLSRKSKRSFLLEKTIDLHGLTRQQALETLVRLLAIFQSEGVRNVLVITGGSISRPTKIRSCFGIWINEPLSQYIATCTSAAARDGGEGAFYVTIRKKPPRHR